MTVRERLKRLDLQRLEERLKRQARELAPITRAVCTGLLHLFEDMLGTSRLDRDTIRVRVCQLDKAGNQVWRYAALPSSERHHFPLSAMKQRNNPRILSRARMAGLGIGVGAGVGLVILALMFSYAVTTTQIQLAYAGAVLCAVGGLFVGNHVGRTFTSPPTYWLYEVDGEPVPVTLDDTGTDEEWRAYATEYRKAMGFEDPANALESGNVRTADLYNAEFMYGAYECKDEKEDLMGGLPMQRRILQASMVGLVVLAFIGAFFFTIVAEDDVDARVEASSPDVLVETE